MRYLVVLESYGPGLYGPGNGGKLDILQRPLATAPFDQCAQVWEQIQFGHEEQGE